MSDYARLTYFLRNSIIPSRISTSTTAHVMPALVITIIISTPATTTTVRFTLTPGQAHDDILDLD